MNKSSGVCLFIVVQKMVTDAVLFIRDHRAEVDIGNASRRLEDVVPSSWHVVQVSVKWQAHCRKCRLFQS